MMKFFFLILGMAACTSLSHAQNNKDKWHADFEKFRSELYEDFQVFRKDCMKDYIKFVRQVWSEFKSTPSVPRPKVKPVPPVVMPEEDRKKPLIDKPVTIDTVVSPPVVVPQPKPLSPIEDKRPVQAPAINLDFFGTQCWVRWSEEDKVKIRSLENNDIAEALKQLADGRSESTLADCLALRDSLALCDWGYVSLLHSLAEKVYGADTNEAALFEAYLYMQSGYKMRLGRDENKLYMLFASRHQIYGRPSYGIGGAVYYGVAALPNKLFVCEASFPKEQELSLYVHLSQQLANDLSPERSITSDKYSDFSISFRSNKNLMEFYNTYPESFYDDNFMTKWAIYAQAPLHESVKEQIYPQLREYISGLRPLEALERLLNLVQTGFVYEYDDKVWGHDRAFFSEESLYYPYCDCEDRAIMLSRWVRDLLGLETLLVYYPGHLAMAVAFDEPVAGDYIVYKNKHFTICDPTYINAPVGATMPSMDNAKATVILLNK